MARRPYLDEMIVTPFITMQNWRCLHGFWVLKADTDPDEVSYCEFPMFVPPDVTEEQLDSIIGAAKDYLLMTGIVRARGVVQ